MNKLRISFHPISKDNWQEAVQLKLDSSQEKFVASNLYSILQAKFESERVPLAIYNEFDQMIGFIMYNDKPLKDGTYRISRFMISKEFQNSGYGVVAIQEIINRFAKIPDCKEIIVEIAKKNQLVIHLCKRFGFQIYDEKDENFLAKLCLK